MDSPLEDFILGSFIFSCIFGFICVVQRQRELMRLQRFEEIEIPPTVILVQGDANECENSAIEIEPYLNNEVCLPIYVEVVEIQSIDVLDNSQSEAHPVWA